MNSCTTPNNGRAARKTGASVLKHALVLASIAALSACSTTQGPAAVQAPQPAPAIVSIEEWMSRGDAAIGEGDQTKAREAWRAAARNYPTAKQPWLKLSENYFNAGDYGNAVLAAQEVLQRDPRDRLANSVLAVSGLRLTAGSLAALRDEGAFPVGSRDEAVSMTNALREALGEPVLVPPVDKAGASKPARPAARAPRPGTPGTAAAPAAAPSPAPRAPAPAPAAGNPLDKLK